MHGNDGNRSNAVNCRHKSSFRLAAIDIR
jgi:hypothetical protein